jgi:hypothetical protein
MPQSRAEAKAPERVSLQSPLGFLPGRIFLSCTLIHEPFREKLKKVREFAGNVRGSSIPYFSQIYTIRCISIVPEMPVESTLAIRELMGNGLREYSW